MFFPIPWSILDDVQTHQTPSENKKHKNTKNGQNFNNSILLFPFYLRNNYAFLSLLLLYYYYLYIIIIVDRIKVALHSMKLSKIVIVWQSVSFLPFSYLRNESRFAFYLFHEFSTIRNNSTNSGGRDEGKMNFEENGEI